MTIEQNEYYNLVRSEVFSLLPEKVGRVLEIGCGTGSTLKWLKDNRPSEWAGGVELNAEAAAAARLKLDAVYEGNIEKLDLPVDQESLDLILCLDVLEHLADPWNTALRLQKLLKPGGALIVSVPNIRNRNVVFPLLFRGKWDYAEGGILDKTHLRFFVRETAIQLVESAELSVDMVKVTGLERRTAKSRFFLSILPEWIKSFLVVQYLIRGVKAG